MVDPQHRSVPRFMPTKYRASNLRVRLQALKRAMQRTVYRATRRRPESVAHRWITPVPDLTDREACLFVSYSPDGTLSDQARFHLQAWAAEGFAVVLILCTDLPVAYVPGDEVTFCTGVLVRLNEGYDFAGWASGVALLPTVKSARSMVMVNDSIYGPTDRFAAMVAQLRNHPADLCGAVESMQFRPHVQSFLVRFGPRLLRSRAFARFWDGVRIGDRKFVIRTCELEMARAIGQAGFTIDVLYHPSDEDNPTLTAWRELIDIGFPYVKAQLLRENPCDVDLSGWRELLITQGYDPALIDRHRPGATDAADGSRSVRA